MSTKALTELSVAELWREVKGNGEELVLDWSRIERLKLARELFEGPIYFRRSCHFLGDIVDFVGQKREMIVTVGRRRFRRGNVCCVDDQTGLSCLFRAVSRPSYVLRLPADGFLPRET